MKPHFKLRNEYRVFYVVFQGSTHRRWWNWFTSPKYRHCWCFSFDHYPEPGLMSSRYVWKAESLAGGIDCGIWWADPSIVAEAWAEMGVTEILEIQVRIKPDLKFIPRGMINCVSIIKALLGIRAFWVWTPWQLASYLKRKGAKKWVAFSAAGQNHADPIPAQ